MRKTVVVRGGGDLATGVVQKFYRAGFKVVILEKEKPLAIRRTVALCQGVYDREHQVEEMTILLAQSPDECSEVWKQGKIPILIDPEGKWIEEMKPDIVIDGIMAKKNLGTHKNMASITVALGPGFVAGEDVDAVVETKRGHHLGRLYFKGSAIDNTGIPGELEGITTERVVYAPCSGKVKHIKDIGDEVKEGEGIFCIDDFKVSSPLDGTLRGLIHEGLMVREGMKCADIDSRKEAKEYCYSISDKARAIGGATLEATLILLNEKGDDHDF